MALPSNLTFIVLDTETTGFLPGVHHIIEFAMVRVEKGSVVDTAEQLCSVEEEIPPHVQVLTRIRPADLDGQPRMEDVRAALLERMRGDVIIVGQNIGFDLGFLKREGVDLSALPWIDTSMLASIVFPELASYSLGYLSSVLGLPHAPQHRALGDVHATLALLERVWDRLLELPEAQRAAARDVMRRAPEGYQRFFEALPPAADALTTPAWLTARARPPVPAGGRCRALPPPPAGTVDLVDDTLAADGLCCVVAAAADDAAQRRWIAVKNLPATLRRLTPPPRVVPVFNAWQLPDPAAIARLLAQETLTADEASLALKLQWYAPENRDALPLHGGERDVWSGKIASADGAPVVAAQCGGDAHVFLVEHRDLFTLIDQGIVRADDHVIVDDASMLEDTATKAFGAFVSLDALRAAGAGDDLLTRIADLASMWAEKVRGGEDLHILTVGDVQRAETAGLRSLLDDTDVSVLSPRAQHLLTDLRSCIAAEAVDDAIVWVESRWDGTMAVQRAPADIGSLLAKKLYGRCRVTLLTPPGVPLVAVLPPSVPTQSPAAAVPQADPLPLTFPDTVTLDAILQDPPDGRTVALLGSKRLIEQAFIRHTETLEARGIDLICQGFNGGQGRMEAEFVASRHAILLQTPWMYEGSDLPPETVDHLIIDALPFDHPSHPVVSRRAGTGRSGFTSYSLPRLLHRLFRLLRTYARHRTTAGEILVIDERIRTKGYGATVRSYLESLCSDQAHDPDHDQGNGDGQPSLFS